MKADFKAIIQFEPGYINLSEKLRTELELKIDKLYNQNRFNEYVNIRQARVEEATGGDAFCAYLLNKAPREYILSGKLSQAIKTWFNMYDHDRLSVTDKFMTYYEKVTASEKLNHKQVASVLFCKFLLSELLGILVESRWENLVFQAMNYRQISNN
jgi:hypothetical protein